ncbi:MAG: hypothetical protein PF693_09900 [Spirochaetia bacterium]|nr:hypothetical protein [Spirochaetia bacterium]
MSEKSITLPELPDITFYVSREMLSGVAVSFQKNGEIYGINRIDNIKSELFGTLNISDLSDREIIICGISGTSMSEILNKRSH